MVCDIEGAEIELIENEGHLLGQHAEWIIMEVHGRARSDQTRRGLEKLNFQLVEEFENNHIYHNNRWPLNQPDGEQEGA